MTVDKDTCTNGVRDAVNYLGSIGDGLVFSDAEFEKAYKKFGAISFGKITKVQFDGMVNAMIFKEPKV